jgi:hypothetical protein
MKFKIKKYNTMQDEYLDFGDDDPDNKRILEIAIDMSLKGIPVTMRDLVEIDKKLKEQRKEEE